MASQKSKGKVPSDEMTTSHWDSLLSWICLLVHYFNEKCQNLDFTSEGTYIILSGFACITYL